jgi:hypothetical protein
LRFRLKSAEFLYGPEQMAGGVSEAARVEKIAAVHECVCGGAFADFFSMAEIPAFPKVKRPTEN